MKKVGARLTKSLGPDQFRIQDTFQRKRGPPQWIFLDLRANTFRVKIVIICAQTN